MAWRVAEVPLTHYSHISHTLIDDVPAHDYAKNETIRTDIA